MDYDNRNRSQFNFNRRTMEENLSDFRNGLVDFIKEYGKIDAKELSKNSEKLLEMAHKTSDIARSYADGVIAMSEGWYGTPAERQMMRDVGTDIMNSIDNIRQNSADLFKKAAEKVAEGNYASGLAKKAGALGLALSAKDLKDAYDRGVETGDFNKLGETVAEILGGIDGAIVGSWLGGVVVGAMIGAGVTGALPFIAAAAIAAGVAWAVSELFDWSFGDWLGDKFNEWFGGINRDGNYYVYDPLVLDLDGDGVELISENNWNGVLFDFNGNGIKTATQWVKSDDGLLVWDRNGNGKIDNGSELFGEDTPIRFITDPVYDGFSALQTIDTHPDFEINAKDDNWQYLKVWRDLNQDGEVQDGELFGLDELGITALSLTAKNGISTYTKADGTNGKLADVNFNIDTIHSEYIEHINLSEEYLQLPNLHGVGMLRDLREASSISEELKWIVQLYQNANTKEEQLNLLDSLMQEWAKTDPHFNGKGIIFDATFTVVPNNQSHFGITPSQQKQGAMLVDVEAMNNYVNAIKYAPIVDSFLGTETKKVYYFGTKMAEQSIKIIIETYEKISQHLYQSLLMQTRLKPYADEIELVFNNDELVFDFDKVEELFQKVYSENPQKAFIDLAEFIVYGNMGANWNGGYALLSNWANELNLSGSLNDYLELLGNDVIDALTTQNGTDADDFLTAISLLNRVTLNGHNGKDTLIAGNVYNILSGGEDSDVYVFDGDFGSTEINALDNDIIELRNISQNNIEYSRNNDDLVLTIGDKTITIKDIFAIESNSQKPLEKIITNDGEIDIETIKQDLITDDNSDKTIIAYHTDDVIHVLGGDDIIDARGGNDYITVLSGNNQIDAGNGDDTIYLIDGNNHAYGGDENDTIISGAGDDLLEGGIGSDTYIFNRNFGTDTVLNFNPNQADNDVIQISGNLKQYSITRNENDLIIQDKYNQNNQITVQNYFENDAAGDYAVQQINFNNISLNIEIIKDLVQQPTWGNDVIYAYAEDSNLSGNMGDDRIVGNIGNDVLSGGVGFDVLEGGAGNDRLDGGLGNDTLQGDAGDDVLLGGAGSDVLHGGSGNDVMQGGIGNDVYVFNRGDGQDTISDTLGNDTLKISANLQDLWFAKDGKNINISIIGTDDVITIEQGTTLLHRIENIELDDGSHLSFKDMNNIINTQSHFANSYTNDTYIAQQMIEFNQIMGFCNLLDETFAKLVILTLNEAKGKNLNRLFYKRFFAYTQNDE